MHSRAYLLVEREYEELQEAELYGISVRPATDSFMTWIARIQGLKDSLWEGAVLQLSISYTEEYNYIPPTIRFHTIPFHPNVDQTSGKPCIDFLDHTEDWNPRFTMSYLLLSIQALLSNPVMEDAVNLEAANMLLNKPAAYRQMVLGCVKVSRQIDAGALEDYTPVRRTPAVEPAPAPRKIKAISFEDYHKSWREIGTSAAPQDGKSARPESRVLCKETTETSYINKPYSVVIREIVVKRPGMMPAKQQRGEENTDSCVFCRLSENCGVELTGHAEPHYSQRAISNGKGVALFHGLGCDVEPQEEEVDHLVAWTNTLCSDSLED
ncbi:ubiquitin-conjugating enzyme E2 U isoform X2 [Hyperolius riggenbachi]|uniref:ubiquitin-conjugating enzyme E2 U isoform X2 n=1 Tax=Hyperolius riggenbachi TaxID=752182 RepID=UPI0035A2B1BC